MHNPAFSGHQAQENNTPFAGLHFATMSFVLIIVIGWLYVTILVAANEPTAVSGIISFLFYGALPCSVFIWMAETKVRRQRQRYQEAMEKRNAENQADQTQP